jgi:hypothetical protein
MSRNAQYLGIAALAALGTFAAIETHRPRPARVRRPLSARREAARRIDWGAALLALAALSDSGIEHYRGSFHNKAMYVPLGVSALTLAASVRDALAPPESGEVVEAVDYLALGTGILGTGFHLYNIGKRPGGFSWLICFMRRRSARRLPCRWPVCCAGWRHICAAPTARLPACRRRGRWPVCWRWV